MVKYKIKKYIINPNIITTNHNNNPNNNLNLHNNKPHKYNVSHQNNTLKTNTYKIIVTIMINKQIDLDKVLVLLNKMVYH